MSALTNPTYQFPGGCLVPLPVRFTIGVDLGKIADFNAMTIIEERPERVIENFGQAQVSPVWDDDPDYRLPFLHRWPLGTAYHMLAKAVGEIVAELATRPSTEVQLFLDATGVGVAVAEIFEAEANIRALQEKFAAVTITAGDTVTSTHERGHKAYHVPKKDLVAVAQSAIQRHKLAVAEGLPEAETLTSELRNFEMMITASANATFSHRDGAHDDLVLATALALWGAKQRPAYAYSFDYRTGKRTGSIWS